ncbi:MAG TPA: hypothetical protein VGO00_11630 [Kofleriaceae bacterium]|nr:hypothetical protein [Kofleriaceae bacterium]
MNAWYPRHWGQTTELQLAKFLAELPPDTTGIRFRGNVEIADGLIDTLGPVLPRLRDLGLVGVPIGAAGMRVLANDPRANALEVLLLGGVMATEIQGPTRIPQDKLDPKLLALATCRLTDDGLLALAHATQLPSLRQLDLSNVVASGEAWLAFAGSPLVRQLECLVLGGIDIAPATMEVLCDHAIALRSLAIETSHADDNARVIASSRIASQLQRLGLRWVNNETVQLVLDGPWPKLQVLEVMSVLDARTIEIIANRRGAPALRTLYVNYVSQIATGGEDVWTDWTGAVLGSSPTYLQLADLVKTQFPNETIKIESNPAWPATWLDT